MGKIKSRVLIVLSSIFAVSVAAFLGVTGLTKANAAENLTMKYGASIKCSPSANGLRFTAYVPDYNESENATYGMLIAPTDYVANYPLTVENVFGENAVYDWAVKNDDGVWVYTGNKTRIINVSYDSLGTDKDGNYVVNGSILGIKDGNLTRNFVGRAYKKVGDEYTMAEWATASGDTEAKISNSIRSALEVATAARLSGDSYSDDQAALIEDYEKRSYELANYESGDDYTLWFTKTTDSGEGSTTVGSEITDSAEFPEGISKGYQLNVNSSGNWHRVFRNGDLSDYVRLKYWVKGKYTLPRAGRNPDGESVWYPVEYVKQSDGLWDMYYNNELKIDNDTCLDIIFSDTTYVTDLYGVRDLRNSLRTVTYKDGDEVLHVEYVQKGRSAKYTVPSEDLGDGYIEEKEVKWTTENGGSVEANLDSITENITVYASYTTLIYKNYIKPKYVTAMSLNKYIAVDSDGNIAFMVRLVGGAATVSVHNVDNTHADSERIILQSDWLSEGVWVIFKTDVANEKVYLCNENGTVLKEKDYPNLDATTLLFCADDTPSADVAAVIVKKNYNLNTLVVLNDYNTNVTPKDESGRMYKYAVEEFVELYEKLSGKSLSVLYKSASDIVEGENCFYLGSGFAIAAGFNCDELTTDTGYSIRKSDGNVYLYGKTGFGSLNAVYGFLKQVYGLEFYTDEVYTYNKASFNYYELAADDFNPSIEYNWASGSLEYIDKANGKEDPNYAYQCRLGFVNPWQMMGGSFHNYFDILPTETYQSAYPNWYTDACEPGSTSTFTTLNLAYGITESDSAMARAVAKYIYENIKLEESENRVKPVWIFGQPDVRGWSTSSESAALKEKYGSYSAESILFLKKVAKILDDEYTLGRKLELVTLAYNLTLEAPSKNLDDLTFYNGNEVNMGVMYAPIESNLYRSATDTTKGRSEHSDVGTSGDGVAYLYEKSNAYYFGQLDEWKKLLNGGDILCYYYSAHYDNYFAPLDSITNMQSKYAAFANAGVKHMYNLGQCGDDVSTDWTALKIYLQSKYGEDAYRTDGDTLILNFCNAYYGAAGNTMYELYKAYATAYKELSDYWTNLKGNDPSGCHMIRKYAFDENAWGGSDAKLLNLYAKIETALNEVEANSEEYKRIQVEGITYRYLLAGVFGNTTKGTIADIATDAKSLGIDIFAEGSPYTATAGGSGNHYNTSGKIEDLA